ncbi:MAG: cellobiose phosphorylase [Anaerolineales bacterium]|jgi:hypothetical protein
MQNYRLDDKGQFLIEDYQSTYPFSSFLPGIAGPLGVPLWVFYVNRGQAIASFGVENKDNPIVEFQPANRAYQLTSILGFRTFFRIKQKNRLVVHEPFTRGLALQRMVIGANELALEEIDQESGLQVKVVYFLLPGEIIGGLVRRVEVTNQSNQTITLEMLDGLPAVIPFGVNDRILKEFGRTVEAWMEVYNLEQNIPFYHLRACVEDVSEVSSFEAGHFMLAFQDGPNGKKILPAVVDPILVFGQNTTFNVPEEFYQKGLDTLLSGKQISCGRTPCGFTGLRAELEPGEFVRMNSIFGHASSLETIASRAASLGNSVYLDRKRFEANELVLNMTDAVDCHTAAPAFDAYCRQTFLDNILRGGWPLVLGREKSPKVFHVYSRKHGDLERDYNAFSLAPEFYSQGNGSYRDVNQNRRDEVWFNPAMGDSNIRTFMSFIQLDGYNPLVLLGSHFTIAPKKMNELLAVVDDPTRLLDLLAKPFTPGGLLKGLIEFDIHFLQGTQAFINKLFEIGDQQTDATFGEGYWVDHWTYNLDLIENYLHLYPDQKHNLLLSREDLPFYDSPMVVPPRTRKYILLDGKPHQVGRPIENCKKAALISSRAINPCWARVGNGLGVIYRCSLFAKLFSLAVIKFATLDPCGMGVEMEAGRPGWYDALNGLPGLFGSSMPETYTLKRLIGFLRDFLKEEKSGKLSLPLEMIQFLHRIVKEIMHYEKEVYAGRDYLYWDKVSTARENYRSTTCMGLDGAEGHLSFAELERILGIFETKVDAGIRRALAMNNKIPPTYFTFRVDEFEILTDKNGNQRIDGQGRPYICAKHFTPQGLPLFLEGIARAMSVVDRSAVKQLYKQVKNSSLYDRKLKMYKVNAPLENLSMDVGRARAFTPGWLENESIWLHMEYKYLLEVLRAGLYEDFFEDFKVALIPFLDPEVYGRSILENSSFLVSSVHPDELMHGRGFVARLSGATAEFISLWRCLMAGEEPFFMQGGQLCLSLKPILPGWLFDKDNMVSFKFLGSTKVIYHNPSRRNTFDPSCGVNSITLHPVDADAVEFSLDVISAPYAEDIREGLIKEIDVYFG